MTELTKEELTATFSQDENSLYQAVSVPLLAHKVMTVTFFDRELDDNPLNATKIDSVGALDGVFRSVEGRAPFFFELIGENGKVLLVGFGPDFGCVQYGSVDGMPPYLIAVETIDPADDVVVEFLMGGTLTPVVRRHRLSREAVQAAAKHFLRTGERTPELIWEEI